jgi:hypothetical protein
MVVYEGRQTFIKNISVLHKILEPALYFSTSKTAGILTLVSASREKN